MYVLTDSTPPTSNTSLTDELKLFYAGFDRINTEAPIKAEPPPDDLTLFFNQRGVLLPEQGECT